MSRAFFSIVLLQAASTTLTSCAVVPSSPSAERMNGMRKSIYSHDRAVSACYEQAIDARPGAMGKVVAEWDLYPDGHVDNVGFLEVDPSLIDIKPCLKKEIATWKFEPGLKAPIAAVSYPFFFDERKPFHP